MSKARNKKGKILAFIMIIVTFAVYLFVAYIIFAPESEPDYGENGPPMKVHFIDVGQGDSTFIELPNGETMLIDAGEEDYAFEVSEYIKNLGYTQIDYCIGTHAHSDHIGGLDDVRALNFVDYPHAIHPMDIYATQRTLDTVQKDFDYAFVSNKYRGVPEIRLHTIQQSEPFRVGEAEIVPIAGHHSPRFEVTGFRFGRLAYLTDFKQIEESEVRKLAGVEVLVVNALRIEPHDSHFNLEEALSLIRKVQPRQAFLTHMSHDIGFHDATSRLLPEGVALAYDGLEIELHD